MKNLELSALRVPQQTRQLDNGLRVVVHEDHASPIVAVHLMYHVGSRHERPGRTGLAHLLEHLLFEGSQNCAKGEFDRLLERVGGTNNGSTWLDRTNYYEVVPSHALELALWLERDRMGFFLPGLDEQMLEVQRGVVINERRQSYENRPYGMADERLHQLLFPGAHPYSWPTIGYQPDLEAISLDDARGFFERHYTPANAVLVIAGDVTPDEGFRLAERYFGDLPSAAAPAAPAASAETPFSPGSEEMEDRVSFPRVYRAYSVAPYGTPQWTALDALTYLLADGESSRLQRRLVRELQVAQEADAYLYPTEVAGVFGIVATARSGVDARTLEEAIDAVIREVSEEAVADPELAGAIRRARRDQLGALGNVESRAEELAYAATVLGRAEALEEVFDSYRSVTAAEVRECAAAGLAPGRGATLRVVPDEEGADEL